MIDIWLDDERDPTDEFIQREFGAKGNELWIKTTEECIELITQGNVRSISFDNDLGYNQTEGRKLARWIESQVYDNKIKPIVWRVHTQNIIAYVEIYKAMQNADKYWEKHNAV